MSKITLEELARLTADPEADVARYFVLDEEGSDAFAPRLVPDPGLVEIPPDDGRRGPLLIPGANWLARRRRRIAFGQKLASGYDGPVIVSEGDSWFQYPFRLEDTIDHLMRDHAVLSLGAAGDTLETMVRQQEYLRGLEESQGTILLTSAGGNDLLGGGRLADHLEAHDPALKPADYLLPSFGALVAAALGQYERLFRDVAGAFPWVRVICHGYDYPVPDGGRWLGRPMAERGIVDPDLQRAIAVEMMDVFNRGLRRVARRLDHVSHLDCRGVVGGRWHDELHPTDKGYADVAALFAERIEALTRQGSRAAPPTVGREVAGRSLHLGLNAVDEAVYGSPCALRGCENDALAMERLAAHQGFETRMMLSAEAELEPVLSAVGEAADALGEGDMFLWTVACHGTQVPDEDGDETDDDPARPLDEALMLYDWLLKDDDIHALWGRFAPGVRIMMVADTCHSGTMVRLPGVPAGLIEGMAAGRPVPVPTAAPRHRFAPEDVQARIAAESRARHRRHAGTLAGIDRGRRVRASVLNLAACQDHQLARDGERHGAFTEALLRVWDGGRFRGDHDALHAAVTATMGFADQVPKLYATGAEDPTFRAQLPFTIRTNPRATVVGGGARPAPPPRPEATPARAPAPSPAEAMMAVEGPEDDAPGEAPTEGARWGERGAFDAFVGSLGLRHFAPAEFLVMGGGHVTRGHPGFGRNTPPPRELWPNIANTARVVDELRRRLGAPVAVTNAYRSPAYNAAVGGAPSSWHMRFNALDVRASGTAPGDCAAALREMRDAGLFAGGIGTYDGFVHVDTRGRNRDWDERRRSGAPDLADRRSRIAATDLLHTRSRGPEGASVFAGGVPEPGADDALLAEQAALGAVVNASSVVSFVEGLSPRRKEDVLLSTLFAQRAAGAAADPVAERDRWLATYLETLGLLGWAVEAAPRLERRQMTGRASFERAVLDILASVATGNQLGMLTSALGGLRALGEEAGPIRLLDLETSRMTGGHFQVGAAEAAGDVVSMALGAFHYEWTDERRNVLFVSWGDTRMDYWIGARRMSLSPEAYDEVRDLVGEKLSGTRRALLADVALA